MKGFKIAQLILNIFINIILHNKEKYNKILNRTVSIILKLVFD